MAILKDYKQFDGIGLATGYVRNVLDYQGVVAPHTGKPFTEAMVMGISGGICAGYFSFEYEGFPPHLHFLTRYPFNEEPGMLFERLAIPMYVQQTPNPQKASANVVNALAQGKPAIVWADITTLYGTPPRHDYWLVNPVVVYGYDASGGDVYVADRACVPLKTTTAAAEASRARVGKIKNRMMTIGAPGMNKFPTAIEAGIKSAVEIMNGNSPFGGKAMASSWGLKGFLKWAKLLTDAKDKTGWPKRFAPGVRMYAGLTSSYRFLEVFYTGGRGARPMFADFLQEAAVVLNKPALNEAADLYRVCGDHWQTLTNALLPDHIAPFKETRDLLRRDYEMFLSNGHAAYDEHQRIEARLNEIEKQTESEFPLTDAQAATMRAELAGHVTRLHDAERDAVTALAAV